MTRYTVVIYFTFKKEYYNLEAPDEETAIELALKRKPDHEEVSKRPDDILVEEEVGPLYDEQKEE